MAEAVVATVGASMIPILLKPMIDKAMTVVVDRCDFALDIKKEIEDLHDILEVIVGILPEAEEMQVVHIQIRPWLRKLVDIGYEARDVLDELVTVSASTSAAKRTTASVKYTSLPFYLLHRIVGCGSSSTVPRVLSFRLQRRLSNEIKNVTKRLDELEKQTKINEQFKLMGGGSRSNIPVRGRPESSPFLNKQRDLFVGRELEKEGIMEKLLNQNDNRVQIVPIWGMGGVGKTTLAQKVYNDERVIEEEYPTKNRRWLCVGEKKFNAKEIISKIIDESAGATDVEVYQRKLIEKFRGDRFLIVLDDIWDIDSSQWKLLWDPLTNVGKGGLIIITTRIREVITTLNTLIPNDLGPLSNEDCWQIFESLALVDRHTFSDLEKKKYIGKQIVKKLKGLPLAAEVVGRSLSNEPNVQVWRNFLEAHEWKLSIYDDDVMPALRWSYNRLPPQLKQCFTYCSLFPKDHVFDEKMLVKMWMAHGFIQNVEVGGEKRRPEDTGALYFKQLVYASFFQCVYGRYVMHDMIHDLSILVSNEEFHRIDDLLLDVGQLEKVRHISIPYGYFLNNPSLCKSKILPLKRLLTLCVVLDRNYSNISNSPISQITPSLYKNVIEDIFKQLKSIRVLVLFSKEITYIPECISELIHLRYLDIENTVVDRIPDTLCDLHNLQTLVAPKGYPVVTALPKNIVNMANLRHLRACLSTCKGVKNLTSLQELYSISISKDDKISELGDMQQLRGRLRIKCLENVTSEEDAAQAMMQEKTYIDELKLEFTEGLGDTDVQTKVLDALQCPPNLIYLRIHGYKGLTSPSWMVDGKLIKNLQILNLLNCHQLELLPPLGQLNCLKHLMFKGMGAINKLGEEFYGKQINEKVFFPSLESLFFSSMENLKEWGDIVIEYTSVVFFPCLKALHIFNCPNLLSAFPHVKICTPHMDIKDPSRNAANVMRSLSELHIGNCDGLVVLELDTLVSLKRLDIGNCCKLQKVQFRNLSSLKNLTIMRCPRLHYFPRLDAIEKLEVRACENLTSLAISHRGLNSLRSLTVFECHKLEKLFEDAPTSSSSSSSSSALQLSTLRTDNRLVILKMFEYDLVSLKKMSIGRFPIDEIFNWHKLKLLENLIIFRCEDLQSLPPDIHKLSSLKILWLHGCPKLQALPADGLPLSLEVLEIGKCSLLYERCQVESGLDWHKIKHIPEREIVQTLPNDRVRDLGRRFQFYDLLDFELQELQEKQEVEEASVCF